MPFQKINIFSENVNVITKIQLNSKKKLIIITKNKQTEYKKLTENSAQNYKEKNAVYFKKNCESALCEKTLLPFLQRDQQRMGKIVQNNSI